MPEDLETVLMRCLAKDPAERPADINAMAGALEACADVGGWTQELARAWWTEHRT